ncbi:uncharacterized RDD family membrane protein YckC [Jatrophihabitans sp. GAS493]|uniref:RDD family protein n=1 Tax=Jatrophihabitans sp. GAS493 TaxID=1907575 RepID=UPI000BB8BA49|nr:RDD family protein [Jatrophihabitans sp. GAS493]SOD73093.1 uncharacterized RDD family membrane protein YckC [Jatrophihabitans sp. GAS493]
MSSIISGEGVAIDLAPAGVGTRTVAALIDLAVELVILFCFALAAAAFDTASSAAVLVVGLVCAFGGYPTVCEWLSNGKTLGKLALGVRAVRDDGGPLGFRRALVRGLSSLLLEKPGLLLFLGTSAGILTATFSERNKRIGDLMAGSFVINERTGSRAAGAVAPQFWVPPQLVPWAVSLDLTRLDDQLALSVRQFVTRASEMSLPAQQSLGNDLRARLEAVIAPPPPWGTPTPLVLTTVLAERRRRTEAMQPGRW